MSISPKRGRGKRLRRPSPLHLTGADASVGRGGRQRRRPRPAPKSPAVIDPKYEVDGVILVLFETPSGFAIFYSVDSYLYERDAVESIWTYFACHQRAKRVIWLQEFQCFKDKSDAINLDTGVNNQLTDMLKRCHRPKMKLAVGKQEYKTVIEASLGITCLFNEAVMEVMWGLKYLMPSLVPQEKSKLAKEEHVQTSKGLNSFLNRYGFPVKPEMVNKHIVETACMLFDCDFCLKKHLKNLRHAGEHLYEVSGIDSNEWDVMKLATALKIVCYPEEKVALGNPKEMFSSGELSVLVRDAVAQKYDGRILKATVLRVYNKLVFAYEVGHELQRELELLLQKPDEAENVPLRK
ncbi:hypothetical protein ACP70R_044023 [Stipagrostis hirtigluma subsp. patula]